MERSALSGSALLARIPSADLAELVSSAQTRTYKPGQLLFQRGDPGDGVHAIVAGSVRVFMEDPSGAEVTIATRKPGTVLGELSLIDGLPRSASASAIGEVSTLRISTDQFKAWLFAHPEAAWALLTELSRRLREATDQVAEIALLDVETRVARRLWNEFAASAAEGAPAPGASLRVHQGEMAAALGVTRESVNKHLARLRTRGIISIEGGRVALRDPDALEAIAAVVEP